MTIFFEFADHLCPDFGLNFVLNFDLNFVLNDHLAVHHCHQHVKICIFIHMDSLDIYYSFAMV